MTNRLGVEQLSAIAPTMMTPQRVEPISKCSSKRIKAIEEKNSRGALLNK